MIVVCDMPMEAYIKINEEIVKCDNIILGTLREYAGK